MPNFYPVYPKKFTLVLEYVNTRILLFNLVKPKLTFYYSYSKKNDFSSNLEVILLMHKKTSSYEMSLSTSH